ncbi:unnamed protein product [Lathyrus sativus]|nr:unnamed protein product [Lathyrus sativus]
MGLDCVKIYAYHNDCVLHWKEYENLKECLRCGESRYKNKDNGVEDDDDVTRKSVSSKVMWYLSIIQRFKKLFANLITQKVLDGMQMTHMLFVVIIGRGYRKTNK